MESLCVCWRGPPGSGKRTALHAALRSWAQRMGQPFTPVKRIWDAPASEQTEDGEEIAAEKSSQAGLPMEISTVHWGFDVARMSLQDKQHIKEILKRWGRGSQVLSTSFPSRRCLVFYHAHLLSSESIILLQSFLELNHKDSVVWATSELPIPARLSDWFLEVPVAGPDRALRAIQATPSAFQVNTFYEDVKLLLKQWTVSKPVLADVKTVRTIVYSFLHRNIRWCEGFHTFLFALHDISLPHPTLKKAIQICIEQPYTGPGQTVPSYRIPMLWENFLLRLRETLSENVPSPTSTPQTVNKRRNK